MNKATINKREQLSQLNAQQTAMNHQLHISSINTLIGMYKELYAVPDSPQALKDKLTQALDALLDPFIPQPVSNIIS